MFRGWIVYVYRQRGRCNLFLEGNVSPQFAGRLRDEQRATNSMVLVCHKDSTVYCTAHLHVAELCRAVFEDTEPLLTRDEVARPHVTMIAVDP